MKIDPSTLENIKYKATGEFTARCPACANEGHDKDGNHLIVYPDGKFGCAKHSGNKEHNRKILAAAGMKAERTIQKLTVKRLMIPESSVIMDLGRLGRPVPTHCDKAVEADVVTKKPELSTPVDKNINEEVGIGA